MKRLLTLAAMFLCCMATSFAQFSGSGSGTENDPYLILNPIQLNQMRNFLNKNVYFKLMADIDLTEFIEDENPSQGWQPIGTSSASFTGVFDGNGHTISGLWINRPNADYVGLFAHTGGSETITIIKNLILDNANVKGKDNIGLLIGYSVTTNIINCTISGSLYGNNCVGSCVGYGQSVNISEAVSSAEVQGSNEVGGIIGTIYMVKVNAIKNNIFRGSRISGNNYVGGICGNTHSTKADGGASFSNCYATSNVEGNNCVGGVCGQTSGKIEKCRFRGNVSANSYVGGICGDGVTTLSSTEECYAIAHIKGQGEMVGGLFGRTYTAIKSCYFCGTVIGNEMVGGLVGLQIHNDVEKSYSNSKISGVKYIGGLCGFVRNDRSPYTEYRSVRILSNVTILSSITASDNYVGRIYGGTEGGVLGGSAGTADENKAWNRAIVIKAGVAQDVEDDDQNGTGVSATTLKLKATYVGMGWDFNDIWDIQETECYPYFKTQTAPPVITSQLVSRATTISGKCVDGGTVTLEVDGTKQQMVSAGHQFSFTVSPLQAGHDVRLSAKADDKEPSYYTTQTVSYLGKGTESDPYQIYTPADLTGVYRKGYFKLMNDIDLTDYINQFSPTEGWESIGREGSETIHFDGNGKKITGLWCNSTRDNTGLFSCFANGTIKNLTVEVASGKQVKGGANTGILIGKMINGTIENCKVSGTVADGTPVGGIVGLMDNGKISLCEANVALNTTGERSYVGGIVGEITGGTLDQCVTTGTLTATGTESYVGGLVGKNYATITNCYSTADNTSSYNAAGIVAYNYSLVEKCLYTGNLYSNNYAAGIIGYNDGENAVVQNCVATSNKIEVVYESQQVQQGGGYGQRIIGGIKNNAPAPEFNNYALKTMQVSLNDVPQKVYDDIMNGVAKTNAELKQQATYQTLGWDFTDIWNIDEDSSYPYQTVKAEGGSDPVNPNPDDPDPQTVVEVTDVSNMANAIYVEPLKGSAGSDVNIEVKLKNASSATSYGFELVLPAGVTISTSTDGDFDDAVTMSARHKEHTLTTNKLTNNTYKVAVISLSSKALTDNDGVVLTIKAHVDDNIIEGEYAIGVQSPLIVNTDGTKPAIQSTQSKITIEDYIKGDVDGDGVIDLADAVLIINYYVGKPVSKFVEKAADVDGDGEVDVADAVRIVNYVVGKISALAPRFEWNLPEPE